MPEATSRVVASMFMSINWIWVLAPTRIQAPLGIMNSALASSPE